MPSEDSIRTDASTVHRAAREQAMRETSMAADEDSPGRPSDAVADPGSTTDHKATTDPEKNDSVDSGAEGSDVRVESAPRQASKPIAAEEDRTGSHADLIDSDEIAQAKTVIRGSSRVHPEPANSINRSPAAVAQVLLGQHLNQYYLEELIGGGGMGAVFRAHDEQLDRTVAIKVVPFVSDDPDLQRRFRNEAQSAAKLDDPRIARVFDAGNLDQWHYIVFEYIAGTNIRDLVHRHGVLSIDDAVFYTSQLAGALQHAADRGIVHRDVKPSNAIICSDGQIKLVDMGLARSDNIELSEDMTASGVTLGTFDYISPEQAKDPRDADLRSDLYSLGCTLYFMLTGSPPYPGGTMLQKLLSHGNAPPPDPRHMRPEVSDNLAAVIQKMMAKDPNQRYQTGNALIADLHEVAIRDGLARSRELVPVAVTLPHPFWAWLERNVAWVFASIVLIVTVAWLQLQSVATPVDVAIPTTAARPDPIGSFSQDPALRDPLVGNADEEDFESDADSDDVGSTIIDEESSRSIEPPTLPITEPLDSESVAPSTIDRTTVPMPNELVESPSDLGTQATTDEIGPEDLDPRRGRSAAPGGRGVASGNRSAGPVGDIDVVDDAVATTPGRIDVEPVDRSKPTTIRVVDSNTIPLQERDPDGAYLATTLNSALEMAARYDAGRIELDVTRVESEPVLIRPQDDLQIISTVPGGTIIAFQPVDSVAMERSNMITIDADQNDIAFEHVHFYWNVPSGDIEGGTLFQLYGSPFLRLTDATVTISNPTLREEVYAIDVVTDPDRRLSPSEGRNEDDSLPLVWIELNNVVVRGQMTMIHMDYATRLRLFWDNGLLAVTERMIDTAGARVPPSSSAAQIRLSMQRMVADVPLGLVRMRLGVSGPNALVIRRFASRSIFMVGPDSALVEVLGLPEWIDDPPLVQFSGASNVYAVQDDQPLVRLSKADGTVRVSTREDFETNYWGIWDDETTPQWQIQWLGADPRQGPTHQRLPSQYRPIEMIGAGLDESRLPAPPLRSDST